MQTIKQILPVYVPPNEELRKWKKKHGSHGVMYGGDYGWTPERQVREAYGDSERYDVNSNSRSLMFHTELLDVQEAIEAAGAMPRGYNGFRRADFLEFLAALPEDALVIIGRENSPACYVWLPGVEDDAAVASAIEETLGMWHIKPEDRWVSGNSNPNEYSVREPGYTVADDWYGWQVPENADGILVRMWWD